MDNLHSFQPHNPLIVQSDHTMLLEVHNPLRTCSHGYRRRAELEKALEHIHTYRITRCSLWNAAAAGLSVERITATLVEFAKYPVPQNVLVDVRDIAGRWGRVRLVRQESGLVLTSNDTALLVELARHRAIKTYLGALDTQRLDGADPLSGP